MAEKTILVVNGYGSSIRKKSNRSVITNDGETSEYPVDSVEQVLVTGASSLSSGFLAFAADEKIDVVICKKDGLPSCRLVPCHSSGIATVRRNQIIIATCPEGYSLISDMIRAKITHMGSIIRAIGIRKNDLSLQAEGENILRETNALPLEGLLPRDAEMVRGIEGEASHRYFSALARVISPPLYIGGRSKHPALDPFNSCLNYGYGILYGEVEKNCLLTGLDPYAGFLHADRYGNKSMVYDLIEPFRQPVVDRVVISLALHGRIAPDDLDEKGYLTIDARRTVVTAVISRLDKEMSHKGKETTIRDSIRESIAAFAHALKDGRSFIPFQWEW